MIIKTWNNFCLFVKDHIIQWCKPCLSIRIYCIIFFKFKSFIFVHQTILQCIFIVWCHVYLYNNNSTLWDPGRHFILRTYAYTHEEHCQILIFLQACKMSLKEKTMCNRQLIWIKYQTGNCHLITKAIVSTSSLALKNIYDWPYHT